mgnify:CR=1 FL=1
MSEKGDIFGAAASLFIKAVLLAARWAGGRRSHALQAMARMEGREKEREILLLRDKVTRLEALVGLLQRQLAKGPHRPKYTLEERLCILWHLEYFQVPRRRVRQYFGIARSTLYRWLHGNDEAASQHSSPANKTPGDLAGLVLEIAKANPHWGRCRIAAQLALLRVFLSASAVRNILLRPQPVSPKPRATPAAPASMPEKSELSRPIPARYPNHVWSVDLTTVLRWGVWPVYVLVAIDHFSRKIVAVNPLEGPNAGWVVEAIEAAFRQFGAPKHIITDQGVQFTSGAFKELLGHHGIKQRFGAVGRHGSIAVTERAIETLKYEWLRRVPLVRGFDHLESLCQEFALWYNRFRPHTALGGRVPDAVFHSRPNHTPGRTDKAVPPSLRRHAFKEARVTAFSLDECA